MPSTYRGQKRVQNPHAPAKNPLDARTKDRFSPSTYYPMKEGAMAHAPRKLLGCNSGGRGSPPSLRVEARGDMRPDLRELSLRPD